MLWRLATALILLFWAVMTGLLIQRTYFPKESEHRPVPVKLVLARHAAAHVSGTLKLLQGSQGRGNATFMLADYPMKGPHKGYTWQIGGLVNDPEIDDNTRTQPQTGITWNFSGDFTDDERWERMGLSARSSRLDTTVNIGWKVGEDMPVIEVRKAGELIMDTAQALAQARKNPMMSGFGGITSLIPGFSAGSPKVSLEHLVRVSASEATMRLGGKPHKAFVINLTLMGLYPAKAWFTEAGELVRVDLPQDFRLVDLMVLGLDDSGRPK